MRYHGCDVFFRNLRLTVIIGSLLICGCGRMGFESRAGSTGDADLANVDGATSDAARADTGRANLAFASSEEFSGLLGGTMGADTKCQKLASQAGLDNPQNFVALIRSADRPDPAAILADSKGWQTRNGTWIAETPAQLAALQFRNPLQLTELNVPISLGSVWTGATGEAGDCNGWQSGNAADAGAAIGLYERWGGFESEVPSNCAQTKHVYCVETGQRFTRQRPPINSRLMFVSKGLWSPGGGRSAADTFCQTEASAAGLTRTFVSLLPEAGTSALSRVDPAGTVTFQRTDGDEVGVLLAPLTYFVVDAAGNQVAATTSIVLTGGPPDSSGGSNCDSWTGGNLAFTEFGILGGVRDRYRVTAALGSCDAGHVYCVEQ